MTGGGPQPARTLPDAEYLRTLIHMSNSTPGPVEPAPPPGPGFEHRLRTESMILLITTRPDGRPQATPVWFLWDGRHILLFSEPGKAKLRNIAHSDFVVLSLNMARDGFETLSIEGRAEVRPVGEVTTHYPAYVEKYRELFAVMGETPEHAATVWSVPIVVTPTRFLAYSAGA